VLWLDVDLIEYPPDIIERLLGFNKDILHPNCVKQPGGKSFDWNAWSGEGRLLMSDLRGRGELVEIESVGGTMLFIRADLHREGLVFPPFYLGRMHERARRRRRLLPKWAIPILQFLVPGEIETEGLAMMAHEMGIPCWGLPDVGDRAQGRMTGKPGILFLSHRMEPTGGGEVVAAWMLQALQERYDVTLLTWVEPDFAALNRMFGTRIDAGRVKIVRPPAAARFLVDRIPDEGYVQAVAYLLRTMRRMRGSCDAVIASTTMECDLGPGGMQYIHYPYLGQFAPKLTTPGDASALRVIQGLWRGATRPWMVVAVTISAESRPAAFLPTPPARRR
jgi:hypothetical protein